MNIVDHLNTVIDVWFDLNKNHITEQSIQDLKETLQLTAKGFYE